MQLTRLRLNGFKSFVDPTELVIAEGLTGVVGPNGCGKSNLLEALRWVMGENRASAMRGAEMEDVIFAGSARRAPRAVAEVALTVDNSDRRAPAALNDRDSIEITRRITRDAGSVFRVNQKEVRARDVQMLFADASTGAHSPALVRQGQIAELINSRPRARRVVLEEAAGISGLYARRHEAELRLNAAEQNLARVDDVIAQLAQQLAALGRQVRQAQRYREIGEQLRRAESMALWRHWQDATVAAVASGAELGRLATAAGLAERAASDAAATRDAAEAALPPLRDEAAIAAALLQRLQAEIATLEGGAREARATIAALETRELQIARDRDREAALDRDAAARIAALEAERTELLAADTGHDARVASAAIATQEAEASLAAAEAAERSATEELARAAAAQDAAARRVQDCRNTLTRHEADQAQAAEGLRGAETQLAKSAGAQEAARQAQVAAQQAVAAGEAALAEAEAARLEAQGLEASARARRAEAEGELGAVAAEAGALARLLQRQRGAAGQMIDLITVAPGFEKAAGAALADDLRAPLVGPTRRSGWAELPAYARPPELPAGVEPLARVVAGPAALRRRLALVGVVAAEAGGLLQAQLLPGQRLVSRDGDLWRWDGFRAAAEDAPHAAAVRLEQLNRAEALKQEHTAADARAKGAARAHDLLKSQLVARTDAERAARDTRRQAETGLAEAMRGLSQLEAARTMAASRVESLKSGLDRAMAEAAAAATELAAAEAAAAALPALDGLRREVEQYQQAVGAARHHVLGCRTGEDELRREGAARAARLAATARELADWRSRQQSAGGRVDELAQRAEAVACELQVARGEPARLALRRDELVAALAAADARHQRAGAALANGEETFREATAEERAAARRAGEAREERARAEAIADAARAAVEAARDRIIAEQDCQPQDLLSRFGVAPEQVGAAETLEVEVSRLKRVREGLGAVNLRAEADAREAGAEHDRLQAEKADLEAAIARLRAGISALNREGRERLLTAFEQVNGNFGALYRHLFGGGEARLQLVESDDPLEAGLEILCQPPGKKLSVLSLLSGGEQTLTALALIFAVFQANPAPICVLDEVDAPLDDANVARFCDLMDEMARQTATRFLVITHHSVTMARMDRLYGVTMAERGVSQLVSVDLKRAEALVA